MALEICTTPASTLYKFTLLPRDLSKKDQPAFPLPFVDFKNIILLWKTAFQFGKPEFPKAVSARPNFVESVTKKRGDARASQVQWYEEGKRDWDNDMKFRLIQKC